MIVEQKVSYKVMIPVIKVDRLVLGKLSVIVVFQ